LLPHAARRYEEAGGIGVARIGADSSRCWVVGSAGEFVSPPATDPQAEHDWRLADIRSGIPQVYAATSELFVAQMLNLDLIDGISFSKGCFTGQEIIARTQHLGRVKRRLHRLRLPQGNWTVGRAVQLTDGRSGRLTEVASTAEGHEALAVLHTDSSTPGSADTPTAPAGDAATIIDAVELPLPYSLT
jgi:folate-binding protein YgfZ